MKKLLLSLLLATTTIGMMAVPAKRGMEKTIKTLNGTEITVTLVGDEYGHYWKALDGTAYQKVTGTDYYQTIDTETVVEKAKARRAKVNIKRTKRLAHRKAAVGAVGSYTGTKKGLIILVSFTDEVFKTNNAYFKRIANEENFTDGSFKGSMQDYFKAQSRGKFILDFDVVGPIQVSHPVSYYGQNDSDGNDKRPEEMVIEAVNLAKNEVTDWAQYDWDNDGEVDQVYVVYAGKGEADGGSENTIWPHAWDLYSANNSTLTVGQGKVVNTYACGAELDGMTGKLGGIGTMCHEFSHCLGYPDFYDIDYSGGQGMAYWDLMDSGSYNGDSFQPAGYTSYERWVAGWLEPIELRDEDVDIEDLKSLQNDGESYIIYNKRNNDEYFLLENRQFEGWDESLPGRGLLILHVDYSASIWENNQPNDDPNHQRMTWIPADNQYQYKTSQGYKTYTEAGMKNDPFPYGNVNAFNKSSTPAAKLHNKNSDKTYYLSSSVEDITQNSDKTVSFKFKASYDGSESDEPTTDKPSVDGASYYESFDGCDGKGGNDGQWSGQIATGELPNTSGWSFENASGANQCVKCGTAKKAGKATTPAFDVNGEAKLTFKAGAWVSQKETTEIKLSATGATLDKSSVNLTKGEFNTYEVTITGTGSVRVTIKSSISQNNRFFLDEVVVKPQNTTAIQEVQVAKPVSNGRIYTLDGRYVGTDLNQLERGLYIINGKKVLK